LCVLLDIHQAIEKAKKVYWTKKRENGSKQGRKESEKKGKE
jgi:hypothetical protein